MKQALAILVLLWGVNLRAQVKYGTPPEGLIPEALTGIPVAIEVMHFPEINDPVKIKDSYYWKHATAILSKQSNVTIIEYGAYLFYNNKWNLRKKYALNELDKNFGTKKQQLMQAQPYVWTDNWRVDKSLFGGWALWYFIGETPDGQKVCGYATIHTTDQVLN